VDIFAAPQIHREKSWVGMVIFEENRSTILQTTQPGDSSQLIRNRGGKGKKNGACLVERTLRGGGGHWPLWEAGGVAGEG